jgi:structure-specific recognition protein 1
MKLCLGINLETKEHALRGWNWGKGEFGKSELSFNVQNRPAFDIPYSEVSNTNLAGKNEVSVEFSLPQDGEDTGTNGALGGARAKGRKAGGARDQLTEIRFYIPGTTTTSTKKEKNEDGEAGSGDDEDVEEQYAANVFYETLMDKAEIGEVAGDTYATFLDVLHLTPRGRFDVDMYESSFRLRGKTYDYKVQYEAIKKFMLLPKPDDLHMLVVIGLDPPLRQGQTRYPFLVMQFKRDEEVELDLNMKQEMIDTKYAGKLQPHYEQAQHSIVAQVFKGLAGKRIVTPSNDFQSHHQQSGVKCSIKASEGFLYCLEKSFMFVPKPAQYISFENISVIVLSRVGGAISASRTFDITVTLKNGAGEHQFSNINREEQKPLQEFFDAKKLKVRDEMVDDVSRLDTCWRVFTDPNSRPRSWHKRSRTRTWHPRTTKTSSRELIVEARTKTRRASTRTSMLRTNRTWQKSTTRHTKVVEATAMPRCKMRTATSRILQTKKDPRRKQRPLVRS